MLEELTAGAQGFSRSEALDRLEGALFGPRKTGAHGELLPQESRTTCLIVTLSREAVKDNKNMRAAIETIEDVAVHQCAIPQGSLRMGGPPVDNVTIDITGSRDGLIYLADRANNRLQAFRQNGEFVAEKILRPRCGAQEQATWAPKRPCGTEAAFSVGFSHDVPQTYLYVADGGSHFITVLRRSDLEVVNEFGGPGVAPGQLGRPHNLTVDPWGNIFVAEAAGPSVKNAAGESVDAGYRAQKFTFTGTRK